MSPRRANPVLAERRREALAKAGYAQILEKGIQATTIDSVVARAGVSKGGALYYYRTREDLLYGVLEWLLSHLDRTLDRLAAGQHSPRARLGSELEVLFHSAEFNRKLYTVLFDFAAYGLRSEKFRSRLASFFERCRKRDAGIIEEGIRRQQFREVNADDAARTLRALVDGYCLHWLIAEPGAGLERYRERCGAVLGAYLLRQPS
ncbi:MAG: TetR/AcrR family transcriptional regulator [Terriglobia bacterium]